MNCFRRGFISVFWCARVICFLCHMNIQQIVLLADDQHVLVNKLPTTHAQEVVCRSPGSDIYYHVPL